jgi:hypothetical protein
MDEIISRLKPFLRWLFSIRLDVCLFIARMEFDRYLAQKTKERAEWEEIFRPSKGPPTTLSAVRTRWVMALLSSLVSVTCFLVGLGAVMQFVTQQLPH